MTTITHDNFPDHLDAYVVGGLSPDERSAVEAHAATCAACGAALAAATEADAAMRNLFASIAPSAHFEENLLMNLRTAAMPRPMIHPSVFRAASGIAAALLLGGLGLIGTRVMRDGQFPQLSLPTFSFPQFSWLNGDHSGPEGEQRELRQLGSPTTQPYFVDALRFYTARSSSSTEHGFQADEKQRGWKLGRTNFYYEAQPNGTAPPSDSLGFTKSEAPAIQLPEQLAQSLQAQLHITSTDARELRNSFQPTVDLSSSVDLNGASATVNSTGNSFAGGIARTGTGGLTVSAGGTLNVNGAGILNLSSTSVVSPTVGGANSYSGGTTITGGTLALNPPTGVTSGPIDGTSTVKGKEEHEIVAFGSARNLTRAPQSTYFKPAADKIALAQGGDLGRAVTPTLPEKEQAGERAKSLKDAKAQLGVEGIKMAVQQEGQQKASRIDHSLHVQDTSEKLPQLALADPEPAPTAQPPKSDSTAVLPQTQPVQRKIIRNGQMEFEVDSFDSSYMQLSKIAAEEGGYVTSTDSEKLSNGKVKGTVTLRVPPDHLDVLVLKLRGLGDLKNQKIAAQDITKQYTDLESGLRAARTMEERLLEIIKNGKGEVKDLVEAEKQLGIYREKIEQIEGELRYYGNLISMSTLNITLFERDIKAPTAAFETEEVQAGLEVEDVEKARADALKAIDDAKGRVIESSLKKLDAGQLTASIVAEVAPEAAGPLTDRLKQLGKVARLEAERKQTTTGGTGAPTGLKMERKATRFDISLYNLANIAPRETVNITLAALDVEAAYKTILAAMNGPDAAAVGRIVSSTLNSQKSDQTSGAISLEVKSDQAAAIEQIIRGAGEALHVAIAENPDASNVTRAKRGYSISLIAIAQVPARETQTLSVAAKDVPTTYKKLLAALQSDKNPSRILSSQLNEQDRQNITAQVDVEVPRAALGPVEAILSSAESDVYSRNASRANDAQNTLDSKVRLSLSLVAADRLQPRETTTIAVEVADVEKTLQDVVSSTETTGGRIVERQMSKQQNGRIAARVIVDVPLTSAAVTLDKLRNLGTVRVVESTKNPQVPEGPLARARFDLTLGNAALILSPEDGVGARLRQGLQTSLNGLTFSLMLIVIGVCLLGPFALIIWAGWRLLRKPKPKPTPA